MAAKTFGVGPEQGYIATRDRLRNIRLHGNPNPTTENREHWFAMKTGGNAAAQMIDRSHEDLPDWLQYL